MYWDVRITLDLFLGGVGIALFFISVLLSIFYKENKKLIKLTAILSPVCVGGGLLFLISELGRPERFLTTMYHFNPLSVTSWGGIVQSLFMITSFVYALYVYMDRDHDFVFATCKILGTLFAILVGIYHGLLLTSLDRPLWSGGLVTILFFSSSLLSGLALVVLIQMLDRLKDHRSLLEKDSGRNLQLFKWMGALSFIHFVLLLIWQFVMMRSGEAHAASYQMMMDEYGGVWWVVVILLGLVIPMMISLYQSKHYRSVLSKVLGTVASLFVLIGVAFMKHIIIYAGQLHLPFFLQ
ncbi:NrfD/PsrC family molybdoenzyme membrane anchor subunit [Anoxybacillus sp. TBDG-1]